MNSNELVWCGCNVEVRLFLIDEERVRDPDVLDKFGAHGERLDAEPLAEREPRIRPELSKVKIQREVLLRADDDDDDDDDAWKTKRLANQSGTYVGVVGWGCKNFSLRQCVCVSVCGVFKHTPLISASPRHRRGRIDRRHFRFFIFFFSFFQVCESFYLFATNLHAALVECVHIC